MHRKNRPISIRWALEPVLGRQVNSWIGDAVDVAAVAGTLFRVATSLGLGVPQTSSGLGLPRIAQDPGSLTKILLIAGPTLFIFREVVRRSVVVPPG